MKKLSFFLLLFMLTISISATSQVITEDYLANINGFHRTKDQRPDSALYYLHKVALVRPDQVEETLHDFFAQPFIILSEKRFSSDTAFLAAIKKMNISIDSVQRKFKEMRVGAKMLLNKISTDSDTLIKNNAYPIAKWVEAQDNENDPAKLLEIGNSYLKYLSETNDFYAQRRARYGLLIAEIMAKQPQLKLISDQLLQVIYANLRDYQIMDGPMELSRPERMKRSWYRYMFGSVNFIYAQHALTHTAKVEYLKLAALYTAYDPRDNHSYVYDSYFLFGDEKLSFQEDYLAVMDNAEDKLKVLMDWSFYNPSFKAKAKANYKKKANFNEYWLKEFNNKMNTAAVFTLTQMDGTKFTLGSVKNQWTLIDFWGTWCGPCRAEHPILEKLYQRTQSGQMQKLNIITVASNDNYDAVREYLKKFNYGFPVAMSDTKIEGSYSVASWPSKFLVSPEGKYVTIPFNVDWVKYIEEYINE